MLAIPTGHADMNRRDAIKSGVGVASFAALGTGGAVPVAISSAVVTIDTARAQPASQAASPVTGVLMTPGYARTIAQMAYVWGCPIVNMLNRNAKITQAPYPGLLGGVLPAAPRGQIAMLHDYILQSRPS